MATKKVKVEVTTPTIDFSNSVDKIKTTAKTVNTEVVDTAYEVLEDIKTNTAQFRVAATEKINEAIELVTIENGVKFVKETAEKVNDYNVETAEEIIEQVVKGGKTWQNFMEKAFKNGFKFYADQQELVFDTLESLKKEYKGRNIQFPNLFNFSFNNAAEAATPKVKKVTKKVTVKAKAAKAKVTIAKKAVKKVAKKTTAKVKSTNAKKAAAKTTKVATKKATTPKAPVAKKAVAKKTTTKKVTAPKAAATKKTVAKKTTTKKAATKTVAAAKNNLRLIEGIGPKIEGLLNAGGINTFQQLADAKQTTLKNILAAAGPRYKMHNPATWTKQAALATAGKREELAKLQAELKGGRVK